MKKRIIERTMFYGATPVIFERANSLRNNLTSAEQKLWNKLSNNKIKGYRFKSQHPINRFIVDFYCHESKLVIEIDGSIHNDPNIKERDEGRTIELEEFGLKVLRFSNEQVMNNVENVVAEIIKYL